MDQKYLYLIIGVLAGILAGIFSARYAVNSQNNNMMNMMGMGSAQGNSCSMMSSGEGMHGEGMSMSDMSSTLVNLEGDEFDQTFIKLMIEHHQGAIDMANLVLKNSTRKEHRDLGNDIISAQTKEIKMMEDWLVSWY